LDGLAQDAPATAARTAEEAKELVGEVPFAAAAKFSVGKILLLTCHRYSV
jgi:hypothetical protein